MPRPRAVMRKIREVLRLTFAEGLSRRLVGIAAGLPTTTVTAHPRVEVAVRTGHSEDVLRMVLSDQAHVGLGRALRHPDIQLQPFYEEELVLVVAPDHPFPHQHLVTVAEVGSEQLIMFDRTSSYYEITHAAFLSAGVTLRGLMELDNIEAAKKMVERGLGIALLPRTAITRELGAAALSRVELRDGSPMRRSIVAMRRRDAEELTGVVSAFLALLEVVPADA
jgi:DNA-binding transcriptional LysR family regulator